MAFTLVSFSENASACLPYGVVNIIGEYTDERNINRCKFIKSCLGHSIKFKKTKMMIEGDNCLFGINNIAAINGFSPVIFSKSYTKEIFKQINPQNSEFNRTLKNLKTSNNAKNTYYEKRNHCLKIILKKCKKKIYKSIKYKSFDQKIAEINQGNQNNIPSLYQEIITNINNLWQY